MNKLDESRVSQPLAVSIFRQLAGLDETVTFPSSVFTTAPNPPPPQPQTIQRSWAAAAAAAPTPALPPPTKTRPELLHVAAAPIITASPQFANHDDVFTINPNPPPPTTTAAAIKFENDDYSNTASTATTTRTNSNGGASGLFRAAVQARLAGNVILPENSAQTFAPAHSTLTMPMPMPIAERFYSSGGAEPQQQQQHQQFPLFDQQPEPQPQPDPKGAEPEPEPDPQTQQFPPEYDDINNAPPPPRREQQQQQEHPEIMRAKQRYLARLDQQRRNGITHSRQFTTADTLEDIRFECDLHEANLDTESKTGMFKMGLRLLFGLIQAANSRIGPFLRLDNLMDELTPEKMRRFDGPLERLYYQIWRKGTSMNPILELGILIALTIGGHHFAARSCNNNNNNNNNNGGGGGIGGLGMSMIARMFGMGGGGSNTNNEHQTNNNNRSEPTRRNSPVPLAPAATPPVAPAAPQPQQRRRRPVFPAPEMR